jgi:EAL domain-containing protein (putative c-di-GMP-specific phosphodiesterase class I)
MRMSDGSICGMEALVRWNHPTRGMVPPDEFISIAEQTGLIAPLTDLVLRMAIQQCVHWRSAGLSVPVAINLSARLLRDLDLPEKIRRVLNEHRAHGSWLEIEITEGGMMEEPERALEILTQLSKMGIALFIDDFGTGYSSLAYLKKLPVDAVKIDKSFVIDMLDQDDSSKIVRSTIALAHDLGLKVVAEGVEDQATLDALTSLHCDVAQGFLLSRPVATEHIAALLRKFPWVATRPLAGNQ